MPERMELLGSTKSKITENEKGENVLHLEITEAVLVHCNNYQQNSIVLFTFVPNKSFDKSLDISDESFIFLKTSDSKFLYIEVWFTDKNSKPLNRR